MNGPDSSVQTPPDAALGNAIYIAWRVVTSPVLWGLVLLITMRWWIPWMIYASAPVARAFGRALVWWAEPIGRAIFEGVANG